VERTLSQLLPGANKVENALRLRSKGFICGADSEKMESVVKPKHGFDDYNNKDDYMTSFLK
jgi:hypothetical protein